MSKILIYFFIGLSLSMDAFSLSISIGTLSPRRFKRIELILIIGLYHFFMPLIGFLIGSKFSEIELIKGNIIVSLIFIILSIEMYINRNNEENIKFLSFLKILLIALSVSIDSLIIGLAFGIKKEIIIIPISIISLCSMIFTYTGLKVGEYLSNKYQEKGKIIGVIILFLLGIKSFFDI